MLLYQEDAELLFPARLIPMLHDQRGTEFQQLIEQLKEREEHEPETLAFVLMMIRLGSCITCTADSYRAMNGCTRCALRTIRSYKGSDTELMGEWQAAYQDILRWQTTGTPPTD